MNTDEHLLLAILHNPKDDLARLIYADYLEETNDPRNVKHAKFIRLQIEAYKKAPNWSLSYETRRDVARVHSVPEARESAGLLHEIWSPESLGENQYVAHHFERGFPRAVTCREEFLYDRTCPSCYGTSKDSKRTLFESNKDATSGEFSFPCSAGCKNGIIPGILNHFSKFPIQGIYITDRMPYRDGWYNATGTFLLPEPTLLASINRELWFHLNGTLDLGLMIKIYPNPNRPEARRDLSRACVKLGRFKAGLPQLPE